MQNYTINRNLFDHAAGTYALDIPRYSIFCPFFSKESHEVTVTRGFTQGLRVRYPVGARRARAGRHIATAPSARGTHAAVSSSSAHTGLQSQQQQTVGMSAHHRSIYLSLQASKTESELEKIQVSIFLKKTIFFKKKKE